MRCIVCDAEEKGLSNFRPDGGYQAHRFHEGSDGRIYCEECDNDYSDLMSDYYEDDLDDEAFEFYDGGDL